MSDDDHRLSATGTKLRSAAQALEDALAADDSIEGLLAGLGGECDGPAERLDDAIRRDRENRRAEKQAKAKAERTASKAAEGSQSQHKRTDKSAALPAASAAASSQKSLRDAFVGSIDLESQINAIKMEDDAEADSVKAMSTMHAKAYLKRELEADDDDYADPNAADLNALLYGSVPDESPFAAKAEAADDEVAAPTTQADEQLMERLVQESYSYKKGKPQANARQGLPTTAGTAAAPPASSSFKQRAAGVAVSTEHLQLTGADPQALSVDEEVPIAPTESASVPAVGGATSTSAGLAGVPFQSHGAFYWLDMRESGVEHGSLCIFGKLLAPGARHYESCCVKVRGLYRSVLFRPMPGSDPQAVVAEIAQQMHRQGIKSFKVKPVSRYYVFDEPEVPREKREIQSWFKVTYSATSPPFVAHTRRGPAPAPGAPPVPLVDFKHCELCIGADRPLIETFLMKRRLSSGPCFLAFRDALTPAAPTARTSHCAHEFVIDSPKAVFAWNGPVRDGGRVQHPPSVPPSLTCASIQLLTQLSTTTNCNEIFGVAVAVCRNSVLPDGGRREVPAMEHMVALRAADAKSPLPIDAVRVCEAAHLRCKTFHTERELLQWLVEHLLATDPDMLLGHNFAAYTLDILLRRMQHHAIADWSAIGRLVQRVFPQLQKGAGGVREATYAEKEACSGRLLVDTYTLAKEHHKTTDYKLLALARELSLRGIYSTGVTIEMVEEGHPTVQKAALTDAQSICHLLGRLLNMAVIAVQLAYRLDIIPLTKQLCTQAGNLWARVLTGNRSERIEFLLLHAFYALKYVVPEKKRFNPQQAGGLAGKRGREEGDESAAPEKRTAKYKGGMVLDPISGLYTDYILLLDFNSLYPSLIQEFSICFTTVNRTAAEGATVQVPLAEELSCKVCVAAGVECKHKRVLPRVIERLVTARREVKRLLKNERNDDAKAQLDIRQRALKLTANSMYGCLGFEFSRFYAQPLAELVTSKGRDTLANTVGLIPSVDPNLRVIYGDTDSVMLRTGVQDDLAAVRELGQKVKAVVNRKYKRLEIDIDGIFRSILLMKKKKYAALAVEDWEGAGTKLEQVVKGLDMVRRDWCPLSRSTCAEILTRVLSADTSAGNGDEEVLAFIAAHMQAVAAGVRAGDQYQLADFVISKSLTKEPTAYKGDNFPHAAVARRMMSTNKQGVRVGDLIPYVICNERVGGRKSSGGADAANDVDADDNANANAAGDESEDDMAAQMGAGSKLAARAYHVDEVRKAPSTHHLDTEWYLSTQIFPPVLRICEHIQGFSALQLAEAMGLQNSASFAEHDGSAAKAASSYTAGDVLYLHRFRADRLEDCFPLATPVQLRCVHCSKMTAIQPHDHVVQQLLPRLREARSRGNAMGTVPLYQCTACHQPLPIPYVSNAVRLLVRQYIRRFYAAGGSEKEGRIVREQIAYLRAAFDVPHLPGTDPDVLLIHRYHALRCLTTNGLHCTLGSNTDGAEDPVLEPILSAYTRLAGMRVPLDVLFGAPNRMGAPTKAV